MRYSLLTIVGSLSLCFASNVYSHSEHDKARFVSPSGTDTGQCENVFRPCKSIAYAVKQANKGDRVLLSAGQYSVNSSEDLFYLKSTIVPILGGYNRFDHFQSQSPDTNITTLVNVPKEMSKALRNQGFRVLNDSKATQIDSALTKKLADYQKLSQAQRNMACENGQADMFACNNIDLLAHFPLSQMSSSPAAGTDIWGHVDLNNQREYAIMAVENGTVIVDVTDPTSPVEVGTIEGVSSGWRDVKVYQYFDQDLKVWQAYAYVTTEGSRSGQTDFVSIIDLNALPHSVSLVENNNVVRVAHNVYISNVDYGLNIALPEQEASLQIVGANERAGAFQSYSLDNPKTLIESQNTFFGNGYTHDGTSITVSDERAQSHCGVSEGSCTIFVDFNENEMKLWNISNFEQSQLLSSISYSDVTADNQYIHSGWGTDDQQYVLLHDEFDEYRGGLNTTVRIFSIEDLSAPVQVGQWTGPTPAIDHNGYVRGNRYYMSNYTRGLTILDITDPTQPNEVGFFDTYPPSNNASFNGAWGVYPFLPSGNILVSDINSGLYILRDNAKDSDVGRFSFDSTSIDTEQGSNLLLSVNRDGADLTNATSVSYQVFSGSAEIGNDFTLANGQLDWAANDNAPKTISIEIAPQTDANELQEAFYIRLFNPTQGATLGQHSYTRVNIAGKLDTGAASFSEANLEVAEQSGEITLTVNRVGNTANELSVTYATIANTANESSDFEVTSGTLTWADGDNAPQTIQLGIVDDENEEESEQFSVQLTAVGDGRLGANQAINITIADNDLNTAPTITLSENFQVNTGQGVTLNASVNDAEGDSMTFLWEQTGGETVTLTNATTTSATFTAPNAAGTLTFSFTATDFREASSSQNVQVSVVAPPAPTPTTNSSSGGGVIFSLLLLLIPCSLIKRRR